MLLNVALELMRDAIRELRRLQFKLSPPILYRKGLAPALNWLEEHTTRRFGVHLVFIQPRPVTEIDRDYAIVLFQCARELVNNLIKHSAASRGTIALADEGEQLTLEVSDDGKGFAAGSESCDIESGSGLFSIREPLALLGGSLSVESRGLGSRVIVKLPRPPYSPETGRMR